MKNPSSACCVLVDIHMYIYKQISSYVCIYIHNIYIYICVFYMCIYTSKRLPQRNGIIGTENSTLTQPPVLLPGSDRLDSPTFSVVKIRIFVVNMNTVYGGISFRNV